MSTKTPEENESDMEAGMTTAERRRRRRRGGGLRVPSDNVPRRISSPAVAPVSEDPSVAIAYTGPGGPEHAVDRVASLEPIAPEGMSTLIDPPTDQPIEEVSFESKTREMSVVDLEELGLEDAETRLEARAVSTEIPITYSTVVIDEDMYGDGEISTSQGAAVTGPVSASSGPTSPGQPASAAPMAALTFGAAPPPARPAAPPTPPTGRPALTPSTASGPTSFAPQAPSAFGTSPGHPPPPTSAAPSSSGPAAAPAAAQASPVAAASPSSGGSSPALSFSGLVSQGTSAAGISLPTPGVSSGSPGFSSGSPSFSSGSPGFSSGLPAVPPAPVSLPSIVPSAAPSIVPSAAPSIVPSAAPSIVPSAAPSIAPPAVAPATPAGAPLAHASASPVSLPSIVLAGAMPVARDAASTTLSSSASSAALAVPASITPASSAPIMSSAPIVPAAPLIATPISTAATVPVLMPPEVREAAFSDAPPPPPRMAKRRAQTLALSEDDLEELLEENRLDARGEASRVERQVSNSEDVELGELDVEVESSGVPSVMEERAAWKSERVIVSNERAIVSGERGVVSGERVVGSERRSDRNIAGPSDSAERALDVEHRERQLTPLGVPLIGGLGVGAAPEAAARSKSHSVPPPTPAGAPHAPIYAAVGVASSPALAVPHAQHAPHPPPPPPVHAPHAPAALAAAASVASAAVAPGAIPGRATPPPSPTKPPPAPPKKAPDKRAAAVAAASQPQEQDKKPRNKAWFADVFDEDYLRTLPFLTPQATQAEAELVAASLSTSPGAKLLDVGCGYGRHAMELAARGYHVVGLDLSTPLLVRGGEEAHRRGLTINFIRGDMRELDFDGQFDGAYCLFSTFGYFDDETNKKTAGNIARALRPGGKCVFEILNRDYVIADLPTRVWWEGDGCVVLEEVDFNYFSSRICVNRSVVFDDGRQLEQEISIRAYSLHEVGKLMLAAGFRVLEVSGSYQTRGRFFGNQSRHIIVVAERTG